jgi:hypothetical protein
MSLRLYLGMVGVSSTDFTASFPTLQSIVYIYVLLILMFGIKVSTLTTRHKVYIHADKKPLQNYLYFYVNIRYRKNITTKFKFKQH